MATPSSSQHHHHHQQNRQHHVSPDQQPSPNQLTLFTPQSASAITAPSSYPSSSSSRRLPPPCWSDEETVALIDTYCDKWYSLRRGNLKASHWQEVADGVGEKCQLVSSPAKTAIQCRHKMEKLRKRYRTEIQRSQSMPHKKFTSLWVHFNRMDCMEKGPQQRQERQQQPLLLHSAARFAREAVRVVDSQSEDDNDDDGNDDDLDLNENEHNPVMYNGSTNHSRDVYGSTINGPGNDTGSGLRIRLTNGVSIAKPGNRFVPKNFSEFEQECSPPIYNPSFNKNLGPPKISPRDNTLARPASHTRDCHPSSGDGGGGSRKKRRMAGSGIDKMASAIKVMGDAFVKIEQNKMEMARELETMRMEMELKRTEMILESQERIVEAFVDLVSSTNVNMNKKSKTTP